MEMSFATAQADNIYNMGPETIAARSLGILAGTVTAYSKQIISTSKPPGPDAIPLKWIVAGRVEKPTVLKGSITGPFTFTREEQSAMLPPNWDREEWELDYGDLDKGDEVVLFLGGEQSHSIIKAIPSGAGVRNFASLVGDIVLIQARPKQESQAAWLSYAEYAPLEQGRKAALRALVNMQLDWTQISPVLKRSMDNPAISEEMRGFLFGIVVFGFTHNQWSRDQMPVVTFLCQQFDSEQRSTLLLRYVLLLKLALRYTMEEAARGIREPLRRQIVDGLKRRESTASNLPELGEQYRELRFAYPQLF